MLEPVLGIDLGTSNSVVATVENGRAVAIPSRSGGNLTPSMVGISQGKRVVGNPVREMMEWFPHRVAWATKRFLGRRFTAELAQQAKGLVSYRMLAGTNEEIRIPLENLSLSLTQISAMVLTELMLDAQAYFGRPINQAVITVPANFNEGQRQPPRRPRRLLAFKCCESSTNPLPLRLRSV